MNRIQTVFRRCRAEGRAALMPYVTAGDPDLKWTEELLDDLIARGADMVELGMPYSDPLADGPTVQAAGQRALAAGTTLDGILALVRRVRQRHPEFPIALFAYYNCVLRRGEERFVQDAAAAGVDGLIIPDLPPEEAESLMPMAAGSGIDLIFLAAPTSTPARLRLIARASSGFIYCVSLTGVTGARNELSADVSGLVDRVKEACRLEGLERPIAVGFGISTPAHVEAVAAIADGVIIGSALIDRLHRAASPAEGVAECGRFLSSLRAALGPRSVAGA